MPQDKKPSSNIAMVMLAIVVIAIILIAILTVTAILSGPPAV